MDKDKKLSNATSKYLALAIISWLVCFSAAHAAGQAKICAQRVAFNSSDYTQEYEYSTDAPVSSPLLPLACYQSYF
ncbi:hypothetical protein [Acetobacter sp. AAB5]|uniref:hypothetical protein n=1 Tax=Acetobacter sp. AAB5 TaxID=3418370 RepID=UPI003CE83DB3